MLLHCLMLSQNLGFTQSSQGSEGAMNIFSTMFHRNISSLARDVNCLGSFPSEVVILYGFKSFYRLNLFNRVVVYYFNLAHGFNRGRWMVEMFLGLVIFLLGIRNAQILSDNFNIVYGLNSGKKDKSKIIILDIWGLSYYRKSSKIICSFFSFLWWGVVLFSIVLAQ